MKFYNFYEIFILIFLHSSKISTCFNVNFHESYDAKVEPFNTQIYKRELSKYFDEASFSFNGFEKIESIPVLFPLDICILDLEGSKYATSLHKNRNGERYFAVFKMNNGTYEMMADIATPIAIAMDCKAMGAKGYIAVAFNITKPIVNAHEGSPIYEIVGNRIRVVQYFATPNLEEVYLRVTGNDFFLLQTFTNTKATPNLNCPYFRWSGTSFNKLGRIPCSNARHLEPFSIDYESYVAVANYADQRGRTETYSEIYKYVQETKKFQLLQKIKTNGAVDVQYFSVPFDVIKRQHFLIFGNSISSESLENLNKRKRENKNREADSVFYIFDRGQFVPYQRLSFYAVEQFLPVENIFTEKFLLLVACKNQDIKIYNLNDWKFEESKTQFTEGALSKGVTNMRIFQENDSSYLVIANELMTDNETNIFLPIFKQDEHANVLRQQIIDWSKTNIERLLKIDVDKLRKDVEIKLSKQSKTITKSEVSDIPNSNIQTVITKSLVYPRLQLTPNYWKALIYANQALDALQNQYAPRERQKRELSGSETFNNMEYEFDQLNVGTLLVREKLKTKRVNGIEASHPEFISLTAKKLIVTDNYKSPDEESRNRFDSDEDTQTNKNEIFDVVSVENLEVTGKLNEFTWDNLMNNTLKRSGLQFVKASAIIDDLTAETVIVTNNEVNAQNLGQLISINAGSYVVNQDIQFAAPVIAKNVVINERLNNIHVFQHRFDVLLKHSNETQVIIGKKRLDNVKVLEPVTIAGKMEGKNLQAMSPNKPIHNDIILNGDYTISGDVTIAKILRTNNLIDAGSQKSVKDVLENGIRMDQPINDVNIKFPHALAVNNSLVSFINTQDVQKLLQTNVDRIQVVEGNKTFKNGSLEIRRGFSDVKILNGFDVENLENHLLLKDTNQTIKTPMHFGKIVAKGIQAPNLTLNNKDISIYLTKSTNQQIQGALKVDQLSVDNLQLENLNTNGKIFNANLSEIYQKKSRSAPSPEIFLKNRKFHGSIYVRSLKLYENSTINNQTVWDIERQLTQLDGNIKYVGNIKFNYDTNVTKLTFNGNLNGVSAEDFGRSWLQKTGDQNFTAIQTFAAVQCERGLSLLGKLNNYRIEDFFNQAYWINRDEHLGEARFQNPIQMDGAFLTNTLNALRVPQDILYRNAPQAQNLYANVNVQRDLHVKGVILNTTIVNGIRLPDFEQYLSGYGTETLHLEHGNFAKAPYYRTLNQHDLKQTLDAVWLRNENVDLQHHVEITEAYFEGLLEFEGPINNMNLRYLRDNCFSLTRPQEIVAEIVFSNTVKFKNDLQTDEIHLNGPVIESKSNYLFNFNEFVANTLKTAGPHEISGEWRIMEAVISGDLKNVQVNQLNLVDDIMRADLPLNEITAPKHISSATIKKLYATPSSFINEVNVSGWILDSVYVYENYTIQGVTTLETVNLYNDLRAQRVNNSPFDEHSLMLNDRSQLVQGNVRVRNKFPKSQTILALNFEDLQIDAVNGASVSQFLANQAKLSQEMRVHSHLTFQQPVKLQEFHGSDSVIRDVKWKRGAEDGTNRSIDHWLLLENSVNKLRKALEIPYFILDHFEIRHTLPVNSTKLVPLTLRVQDIFLDIIGVLNEAEDNRLQFYRWESKSQQFVSDQSE